MSHAHALVIDDNRANAEVLETLLVNQGVEVSLAYPLDKLPAVIESAERIDMIFLDLEFPDADGFDLYRTMRADERLAHVPIIAYSVHTSEVNRVRGLGFQGFLGKPICGHDFPRHLARIMEGIPVWEL